MLTDHVAVVTGGGQGIGREICFCLAKHGAHVVIADITLAGAQETADAIVSGNGPACLVVEANVADEAAMKALFAKSMERFGRVDILVNNSGVAGPMGPTERLSLKDWQAANAVNIDGVFLGCKYAIPLMRGLGKGCIVNISSVSAKRPLLERTSYCATKAAVIGLTRALALECGKWGIRVNSVCPGAVDGPRQRAILEHAAKAQGKTYEEVAAVKKAVSPLNTFVPPASVADVVVFLCSPQASMMTGQDINVSAGAWMS